MTSIDAPIELRSDTFTLPTERMRASMASAVVGNDDYGEDPTVSALEELAASLVGKEAALLTPSGTMGNAIAARLHCAPGDALIAHHRSHVLEHEAGGIAVLWGILARQIEGPYGRFSSERLLLEVPHDPDDIHASVPRLVWIENTHMDSGGAVWSLAELDEVSEAAHGNGMSVHMDGARLFNAACRLRLPAAEIAARADTVQFCLSKGLGAPIGSILAGPLGLIERARRIRKLLGGGMRQAGVIAAAGIYALEHNIDRLAEDHANARRLAEGLNHRGRLWVDTAAVHTNIVIADVTARNDDADAVVSELEAVGVLASALDRRRVRFVTSLEVTSEDIDRALSTAAPFLTAPDKVARP